MHLSGSTPSVAAHVHMPLSGLSDLKVELDWLCGGLAPCVARPQRTMYIIKDSVMLWHLRLEYPADSSSAKFSKALTIVKMMHVLSWSLFFSR
jgi:hypothetical protein